MINAVIQAVRGCANLVEVSNIRALEHAGKKMVLYLSVTFVLRGAYVELFQINFHLWWTIGDIYLGK